jgi:serine/threonine-protein phosphatase PGAM5
MKYRFSLLFVITILLSLFFLKNSFSQTSENIKKGTRTIYLIRHGDYEENDEQDEFTGNELNPLGIAQARLLSARLKSMSIGFSSLTSSTMTRARQTAIIINEEFPDLDLKQNDLICECTPHTWREDIMAEEDSLDLVVCAENLDKAYNEYFIPSSDNKDRNDIIVCHGNVIRYFVTKVLKVDTMAWLQMSITNCSLTIVRIFPDGKMKLDAFSDYGHIPENMRTFTGGDNESKKLLLPVDER